MIIENFTLLQLYVVSISKICSKKYFLVFLHKFIKAFNKINFYYLFLNTVCSYQNIKFKI